MKVPVVKQCCCCSSLKKGCTIIGNIWLEGSITVLISSAIEADDLSDKEEHDNEELEDIQKGILIAVATIFAVSVVLNACFLYGISKDKTQFIFLWLVCNTVVLVVFILGCIILATIFFAVSIVFLGYIVLIGGCLSTALFGYCIIVVRSHYLQLKEGSPASAIAV